MTSTTHPTRTKDRQPVLTWILFGSVVAMAVAAAMIAIGDPVWNLYVTLFGVFVAPPVFLVVGALLLRSRHGNIR